MKKYSDAMIDIETLSTNNNAVILTIGALKFNRNSVKDVSPITLYYRINIKSCEELEMHIDKATMKWWEEQSKEAQYEALYNPDRVDVKIALAKLSIFLRGCEYVWANSPNFDAVILENAYRKCKLSIPWKFWNLRDCRTLYDIANIKLDSDKTKHNSLEDCENQLKYLYIAFTKLKV